jgi:hypothetical protein
VQKSAPGIKADGMGPVKVNKKKSAVGLIDVVPMPEQGVGGATRWVQLEAQWELCETANASIRRAGFSVFDSSEFPRAWFRKACGFAGSSCWGWPVG